MRISGILVFLGLLACQSHAASLDEARRLTDSGDYPGAIAQFNQLLQEAPGNGDLLIEAARVNGWADRNADAASLYLEALRVAPQRLADFRGALAWQLHWAGQSAQALPYFEEEILARPADPELRHGKAEALIALNRLPEALATYREQRRRFPDDQKAAKGEARVLMWLDRRDEAQAAYAAILEKLPRDKEARLGLARIANSQGYHQSAARQLRALLKEGEDSGVRLELARALRWSGDGASALATLTPMAGSEAQELRLQVEQERKNHVRANVETSHDSDDLDVVAISASLGIWTGDRSDIELQLRQVHLEQHGADVDGRTWLLGYGTTLGSAGGEHGLLFPRLMLGMHDYDDWRQLAWTARLKWLPADLWRWDFEAGNSIVENVQSIRNHVRFDYLSGGFDYRFAPHWLGSVGLMQGRFDDGNQRTRLTGRLEYHFNDSPRLVLGLEGMGFRDSDPPSPWRGYWSPDRYHELKLAATVEGQKADWTFRFKSAVGRLWEEPGGSNNLYLIEASLNRELGRLGFVRFYGQYSDSAALTQGTGGGYSRGVYGGTLDILF